MRARTILGTACIGLAFGAAVALAQTSPEPTPAPGGEPTSEALSAAEVQALFNGNTEVTIAMKRGEPTGREYKAFYESDGTYRLSELDGLRSQGSWFVDPLGRHCFRPHGKDKTKCDVIVREGENFIRLRDGERRGQMTIQKGNPFKL
jgi:hypothetical protein